MPSHIFTRVGYWKESIASNIASAKAADADKEWDDKMHGMDYLVYAYLQLGDDSHAHAVVDEMNGATGYRRFAGFYARAASEARYVVERRDWAGAIALSPRSTEIAYADAVTHFARALGAARLGKLEAAEADIAKLVELRDKLRAAKDAYWAEIVDIQRQMATAWVLYAQGKEDQALAAMGAAADAEDKTEKHPVTPGPLAPARELYGYMLLERGMAKEALAAFEAVLKKEPHRMGATIGAAKAAEKAGDGAKARQHYEAAVALAAEAEPVRPEIATARAYLAKAR
jgi:tetratricopeptide (TPR) repeat protein